MLTMRQVPRQILIAAAIIGGLIGIFLSAANDWTFVTTFIFTLVLCMILIAVAAIGYALIFNRRHPG